MASDALRFEFGKNWLDFLSTVTDESIRQAERKLAMLVGDLRGKTVLDVGCGSGLDSLAAVRLGANVTSFDYDAQSVECSREMKRRHAPIADWNILQGSALDETFLRSLGTFDLVYSWGVLHHTGQMWKALNLATIPAKHMLMVSLYADQGMLSRAWRLLKRIYVHHPLSRGPIKAAALLMMWAPKLRFGPRHAMHEWRCYHQKRGMSAWHDIVDWAGGYPYEFAMPNDVISFYAARGFSLRSSPPSRGVIRVNQYLFELAPAATIPSISQQLYPTC